MTVFFNGVCERPPAADAAVPRFKGDNKAGILPVAKGSGDRAALFHGRNSTISPLQRGRAAERGRGSLTRHPREFLGKGESHAGGRGSLTTTLP